MWSFRAWQRKRILARNPVVADLWQRVLDSLPILDGLGDDELARLRERAVLFLHDKRLTALPGVSCRPRTVCAWRCRRNCPCCTWRTSAGITASTRS